MKKGLWTLLVLVLAMGWCALDVFAVESPDNYYSWYHSREIHYCTASGQNGDVCTGVAECSEQSLETATLFGYRQINNLHDPRVLCGSEGCHCANESDETVALPTLQNGSPSSPASQQLMRRFRVYIPQGATYVNLTLYTGSTNPVAVVARWKSVPDCTHCMEIITNYSGYSGFDDARRYTLDTLQDRDVYLRNTGGHITVFDRYVPEVQSGGWLYAYIFYPSDFFVPYFSFSVKVNQQDYLEWYDSASWDIHGDPVSGPSPLSANLDQVSVGVGQQELVILGGGTPPYQVSVSDDNIAYVSLEGSLLSITGVAPGDTTVEVQDEEALGGDVDGHSLTIAVHVEETAPEEVEPLAATPSSLNLQVGEEGQILVTGGAPPYSAESGDDNVAKVSSVQGPIVSIEGVSEGSASVVIRDSKSGENDISRKVQVNVQVRSEEEPGIQGEDLYYSWYVTRDLHYCSATPCGSGDPDCEFSSTCPDDMPYFKTVDLSGYKEINNLHDPKVLCGQEDGPCPNEDEEMVALPTIQNGTPSNPADKDKMRRFRVYIPAGTEYLNLTLYTGSTNPVAVTARWKQPPSCAQCVQIGGNYNEASFDDARRYTLETLEERDVYLRNTGGHITVFDRYVPEVTEGGWLYVWIFYPRDFFVPYFSYSVKVNKEDYLAWYDSALWDQHGDPTDEIAPLSLDVTTLDDLKVAETATLQIHGGVPPYQATVNPEGVVKATVDNVQRTLLLTGLAEGDATVLLSDSLESEGSDGDHRWTIHVHVVPNMSPGPGHETREVADDVPLDLQVNITHQGVEQSDVQQEWIYCIMNGGDSSSLYFINGAGELIPGDQVEDFGDVVYGNLDHSQDTISILEPFDVDAVSLADLGLADPGDALVCGYAYSLTRVSSLDSFVDAFFRQEVQLPNSITYQVAGGEAEQP